MIKPAEAGDPPKPVPARGALAGTDFDQFAMLYEECLKVSPALTPPVVDEMELWQVAVVLGKARAGETTSDATPTEHALSDAAMRRYNAIRRRRAGLPEVDEESERPAPPDPLLATLIPTNAPERLR